MAIACLTHCSIFFCILSITRAINGINLLNVVHDNRHPVSHNIERTNNFNECNVVNSMKHNDDLLNTYTAADEKIHYRIPVFGKLDVSMLSTSAQIQSPNTHTNPKKSHQIPRIMFWQRLFNKKDVKEVKVVHTSRKILSMSGGATDQHDSNVNNNSSPFINVLVSTSVGSSFLDKKKKFLVPANATVGDLKELIHQKFPGFPPPCLQRLYFGVRKVSDSDVLRNLSPMPVIPILLDMITGTSVYSKTLSLSQTIEAYVSTIVQQAYISDSMRGLFNDVSQNDSNSSNEFQIPETSYYRDMFVQINSSLYEKYADDIKLALEEESEPETMSPDTVAWRGPTKSKSPLAKLLAKEFDMNRRGLKNFIYFSALLAVGNLI